MASRIFWIFGPTLPSRTAELKGSIGNRTFMSICIGHLQRRESHYREAAAELALMQPVESGWSSYPCPGSAPFGWVKWTLSRLRIE